MNICAPFAGIVRYHVSEGATVSAGEVIATVEAAKLESPVRTPGPGVVTSVCCEEFGDVVGGEVLAVIGGKQ